MRRRPFLASVAATTAAGCIGSAGRRADQKYPKIAVEASSVDADELTLAVVVRRQFSPAHAAEIEITLENSSASPLKLGFGLGPPITLPGGRHTDGEALMVLIPETRPAEDTYIVPGTGSGEPAPSGPDGGCWKANSVLAFNDEAQELTLGSDESLSETYTALAHPNNEGCLSPGTYTFESREPVGVNTHSDQYESVSFENEEHTTFSLSVQPE